MKDGMDYWYWDIEYCMTMTESLFQFCDACKTGDLARAQLLYTTHTAMLTPHITPTSPSSSSSSTTVESADQSPLFAAAAGSSVEIVQFLLLQVGATVSLRLRDSNRTVLHVAARQSPNVAVLQFLIDATASNDMLSAVDFIGETPIGVSCSNED